MDQLLLKIKDIDDRIEDIRKLKEAPGAVENLRSQEIIQLNWIKHLGIQWNEDYIVLDRNGLSDIIITLMKKLSKAKMLQYKYQILMYNAQKEQVYYVLSKCMKFPTESIVRAHIKPELTYVPYEQFNRETGDWEKQDIYDIPISKNPYNDHNQNVY